MLLQHFDLLSFVLFAVSRWPLHGRHLLGSWSGTSFVKRLMSTCWSVAYLGRVSGSSLLLVGARRGRSSIVAARQWTWRRRWGPGEHGGSRISRKNYEWLVVAYLMNPFAVIYWLDRLDFDTGSGTFRINYKNLLQNATYNLHALGDSPLWWRPVAGDLRRAVLAALKLGILLNHNGTLKWAWRRSSTRQWRLGISIKPGWLESIPASGPSARLRFQASPPLGTRSTWLFGRFLACWQSRCAKYTII